MDETVGSRIKALAIAKALRDGKEAPTAEQIAEALGVSYESLRKWSAGKTAPSRRRAQQIASYLACPAEEFMHGVNYGREPEAPPAPPYSPEALAVAALYDQASPKDRRYIWAVAHAALSEDGPAPTAEEEAPPAAPRPVPAPPR